MICLHKAIDTYTYRKENDGTHLMVMRFRDDDTQSNYNNDNNRDQQRPDKGHCWTCCHSLLTFKCTAQMKINSEIDD